jgi:hybrid cluster-associated redox disulfide protein
MSEKKVKKENLIGDVINKFPEASIIMLSHGLNCANCGANKFETIEEGAVAHGLDGEEIKKIVEEINLIINKN